MPKPSTSSAKSPSSTGSPRKKRPATKKGGNAMGNADYRKVAKNEHDSAPPPAQPSCMRRSDLCVGLVFLLLAAALAVVYVVGGAPADQLLQPPEAQSQSQPQSQPTQQLRTEQQPKPTPMPTQQLKTEQPQLQPPPPPAGTPPPPSPGHPDPPPPPPPSPLLPSPSPPPPPPSPPRPPPLTCEEALETVASGKTCGTRIAKYQRPAHGDLSELAARIRVGEEFPDECGACVPEPPRPPSPPPPPRPPAPPGGYPVASFFAIGDFGYHSMMKGPGAGTDFRVEWSLARPECQQWIADAMADEAKRLAKTDKPLRFVLNAGDSFYPAGLKSVEDPMWEAQWGRVYHGLPRNLPWFSVMGNHDVGQSDRMCACDHADVDGAHCVLVKKHNYVSSAGQRWFMPKTSYHIRLTGEQEDAHDHYHLPGLSRGRKLELVMLDLNRYDAEIQCNWVACTNRRCYATQADGERSGEPSWSIDGANELGCKLADCHHVLAARGDAAGALFNQRVRESKGKQMIVVAHYPTDYLQGCAVESNKGKKAEMWLDALSSKTAETKGVKMTYFGAHRHSTENTSTIGTGNNPNWCVGGGGGWSCDESPGTPDNQGFVVGEVTSEGHVVNLRPVTVPNSKCCFKSPRHYTRDGRPILGKIADVANPWAKTGRRLSLNQSVSR